MPVGESARWDWNGMECRCWLLVDLSMMELLAVAAHRHRVFSHTLPDKTCLVAHMPKMAGLLIKKNLLLRVDSQTCQN
jgi:hypothetical protein